MKKGDNVPVTIAGDVVAQATVEKVDAEANTVTMVFPATRVVMGLKTEIDTTPAEPVESEPAKQTIITGVDRVDSEGNIISSTETTGVTTTPVAPVESAPVVETPETPKNDGVAAPVEGSSETPVGEATQTQLVEPPKVDQE